MEQELIHVDSDKLLAYLDDHEVKGLHPLPLYIGHGLEIVIMDRYIKEWVEPDPGVQATVEVLIADRRSGDYLEGCQFFIWWEEASVARTAVPSHHGPLPTLYFPLPRWLDALRNGGRVMLLTHREVVE